MRKKNYDKKGNLTSTTYTFQNFNDLEADAKAIDNGKIDQAEFLSDNKVEGMINASGVKNNSTPFMNFAYAFNEGGGAGKMDYGYTNASYPLFNKLNKNTLYIRERTAYNLGDIGNYLWGRGMAELGIDLGDAQIGAHANNALFGRRQGTPLYDFGPGTYGAPSLWDSPGDQRAIMNGYNNSPAGKRMMGKARINNENARKRYNENFKTSFSIY